MQPDRSVEMTSAWTWGSTVPIFFMSRDLSIVRIWSKTIRPFLPWNSDGIRVGWSLPAVVMGATMTVRIYRFISSG